VKKNCLALLLSTLIVFSTNAQGQKPAAAMKGPAEFRDVTASAGIKFVHNNGAFGKKYLPETLGPGVAFIDYDNDGWPDIFVADGHIEDAIERVQKRVSYAEPPHVFRNLGAGRFQEVTNTLGAGFSSAKVARGAAYADIDNDGALDILLTTNGGPAYLYSSEGVSNHSLRVKLIGAKSNRDGIGAVVRVASGKDQQWQMLHSGSSYLSQSELVLTFGLGNVTKADSVEVQWPSGQLDKISNIPAGQTITVQEGKGIVATRAYRKNSN
jgi:enediyne biosynthesis protein E4